MRNEKETKLFELSLIKLIKAHIEFVPVPYGIGFDDLTKEEQQLRIDYYTYRLGPAYVEKLRLKSKRLY